MQKAKMFLKRQKEKDKEQIRTEIQCIFTVNSKEYGRCQVLYAFIESCEWQINS